MFYLNFTSNGELVVIILIIEVSKLFQIEIFIIISNIFRIIIIIIYFLKIMYLIIKFFIDYYNFGNVFLIKHYVEHSIFTI